MKPDPILREVYRMKDRLARDVGNDVGKLFRHLREAAKKHPERMVRPPVPTGVAPRGHKRRQD